MSVGTLFGLFLSYMVYDVKIFSVLIQTIIVYLLIKVTSPLYLN